MGHLCASEILLLSTAKTEYITINDGPKYEPLTVDFPGSSATLWSAPLGLATGLTTPPDRTSVKAQLVASFNTVQKLLGHK